MQFEACTVKKGMTSQTQFLLLLTFVLEMWQSKQKSTWNGNCFDFL